MARARRRRGGSASLFLIVAGLFVVALILRGGLAAPYSPTVADPARPRARASDVTRARHVRAVRPEGSAVPDVPIGLRANPAESVHVALGTPRDDDASDDYVMNEREYVVSYNPKLRVPNWVAWKLNDSFLGHARRMDDFRPDEQLPVAWYRVTPRDYAHSGYDRGHMCPSADRTGSEGGNASTFLMSNMQPQLHELNAGPWEKLEAFERGYVERTGQDLYIVAGGVFERAPPTIGHGVAVPKANYKIIVALPRGLLADRVTESTPELAVVMPNEPGVGGHAWTEYLTTIDRVEAETGYDFLTAVAAPVQGVLEARVGGLGAR